MSLTSSTDARLGDRSFWRDLCPHLTIESADDVGQALPTQSLDRIDSRMKRDGYFGDRDAELERLAPAIGAAVEASLDLNLAPVFAWVYDQPWQCYQRLRGIIGHILGTDYLLLPDFWAWHVDPQKSESGWPPHRDKNFGSLARDGSPISLTAWIPLVDANPLNGCIYIVPAHQDPFYNTQHAAEQKDGLMYLPRARALPAKPGEYLIWNQAVLHWGGASSEFADAPRMSIALEFQKGRVPPFNQPLLEKFPAPNFPTRLRLIGKQILQYRHMYGFSDRLTAIANTLFHTSGHVD